MPCPFRIILIVCAAVIALAAAILALRSPVEIDYDGNERPTRSVKQHMRDFYDESVRPWLPEWFGGYKQLHTTTDAVEDADNAAASKAD